MKLISAVVSVLFSSTLYAQAITICNKAEATKEGYENNSLVTIKNVPQKNNTFLDRSYVLQPIKNNQNSQFKRAVFVFHGGGGNGCSMRNGINVKKMSNSNKINGYSTLYIYPNATKDEVAFGGTNSNGDNYYNNASVAHWSDGRDPNNYIDDIQFVKMIINKLEADYGIKKFYAAGFSNGGVFTHYLASQVSKIKGIYAVAGHVPKELNYNLANVHVTLVSAVGDSYMKIEGTNIFRSAEDSFKEYGKRIGYLNNQYEPLANEITYEYTNDSYPYLNDQYSDLVIDKTFDRYPNPSKKYLFYSFITHSDVQNQSRLPGHCWHGETKKYSGEFCTSKYDNTRLMLVSFTDYDQWVAP